MLCNAMQQIDMHAIYYKWSQIEIHLSIAINRYADELVFVVGCFAISIPIESKMNKTQFKI